MHLSKDAVDTVADYLSIFILIFVPIGLICYGLANVPSESGASAWT